MKDKRIVIHYSTLGINDVCNIPIDKSPINDLLCFLSDNINNSELSLNMILNHLNCHKDSVYNICKIFFQMSVMELLETMRLQESLNLMFSGKNKVWRKVGYNSITVFSKAFKRRIGKSMLDIKKMVFTKSSNQKSELYNDLLDSLWKGRYGIYKEFISGKHVNQFEAERDNPYL